MFAPLTPSTEFLIWLEASAALTRRRKDAKAQRREGAKTQRRKDAKAQRREGAKASKPRRRKEINSFGQC